MTQNWDYAELSKAAKAAGGPEKYVEMLECASRDAGKKEMLPWVAVAAVGAELLTTTDDEIQKKRFAEEIGMPRIIRNAIRCKKCGDVIESKTVHDFKFCSCGSCAVDGGHDYLRRCGNLGDWEEMSEAEKVEGNTH